MTQAVLLEPRQALLHPGLIAAGAAFLIAVFVTDALYYETLLFQYDNFSGWLLAGGLLLALFGAIAFVIDLASRRVGRIAWIRVAGLTVAALLGLLNAFVHSRDAYTAVIPEGIALSAIVAVILIVVGLAGGWSLASRRIVPLQQAREVRS